MALQNLTLANDDATLRVAADARAGAGRIISWAMQCVCACVEAVRPY